MDTTTKTKESCGKETPMTPSTSSLAPPPIPFWYQDPNVLIRAPFDFFPMSDMTLEQKLNALTRGLVILTLLGFFYTHNTRLLVIGVMILVAIFLYYWAYKRQEGFVLSQHDALQRLQELRSRPTEVFQSASPLNPMSNVLVTDWTENPQKRPAPPTEKNADNILLQAKRMVVQQNPGQPDIAEKLFADLANEFDFEQSMRPFYSTASSTIPNDQKAFAEFCFGSMI